MKLNEGVVTRRERVLSPIHDWMLCRVVRDEIISPGGIITPETEGAGSNLAELEIVAVGPISPSDLMVGDRVKIVGQAPSFSCDGETYHLVRDRQVPPSDMKFEMRQVGERIESLPIGPPYIACVLRQRGVVA